MEVPSSTGDALDDDACFSRLTGCSSGAGAFVSATIFSAAPRVGARLDAFLEEDRRGSFLLAGGRLSRTTPQLIHLQAVSEP